MRPTVCSTMRSNRWTSPTCRPTVLLTVFALAGWFVSVLASIFLLDGRIGTAQVVVAIAIGVGAAIVALGS